MSKIGIFFGKTIGNTGDVAKAIHKNLRDADVFNICNTKVNKMNEHDVLILGSSTWKNGEVQDDWVAVLDDDLGILKLIGKKVALFGFGDQYSKSRYLSIGEQECRKENRNLKPGLPG